MNRSFDTAFRGLLSLLVAVMGVSIQGDADGETWFTVLVTISFWWAIWSDRP